MMNWEEGFQIGVLAGIQAERQRIIEALKSEAANRSIMEALAYPYLAEELEATIMRDQED